MNRLMITTEEYERTRKDYLSAHTIAAFDVDPELVPLQTSFKPTPEMEFGTAFHALILEPKQFDQTYLVTDGPINEKTGKPFGAVTKKFEEFRALYPGQKIITTFDHQRLQTMRERLATSESVRATNFFSKNCQSEVALTMELSGVKIRGRLDRACFNKPNSYGEWINGNEIIEEIYDLKTCGDIDQFERNLKYNEGLKWQALIYTMLADGNPWRDDGRPKFFVIACETKTPFRVRAYHLTRDYFIQQDLKLLNLLDEFKNCVRTGDWSGSKSRQIITIQ